MSNKTPTPIQQAIEEILLLKVPIGRSMGIYAHNLAIDMAIEKLQSKLPAERKFAEDCFDAGYKEGKLCMQEVVGRITPNQYNELSIDFSTFYKNNYEDGK